MGSALVAHGLSCSTACGIFPDQGSNPCPPALAGGFLTTVPPGKSPVHSLKKNFFYCGSVANIRFTVKSTSECTESGTLCHHHHHHLQNFLIFPNCPHSTLAPLPPPQPQALPSTSCLHGFDSFRDLTRVGPAGCVRPCRAHPPCVMSPLFGFRQVSWWGQQDPEGTAWTPLPL